MRIDAYLTGLILSQRGMIWGQRRLIKGIRGPIFGLRVLIKGLSGIILSLGELILGLKAGLRQLASRGWQQTDRQIHRCIKVHPCVIQDIIYLRLLLKQCG